MMTMMMACNDDDSDDNDDNNQDDDNDDDDGMRVRACVHACAYVRHNIFPVILVYCGISKPLWNMNPATLRLVKLFCNFKTDTS